MEYIAIAATFLPLISYLLNICCFTQKKGEKKADYKIYISCLFIVLASILSFLLLYHNIEGNQVYFIMKTWFLLDSNKITNQIYKINFALYIDNLSCLMFCIINLVSAIVHIYSIGYMAEDIEKNKFFAFLSLFTFFMLILVAADNFLQLFLGWEGVGLCSYLLIGFWHKKISAVNASMKAFIINRIGDFFFIIAIAAIAVFFKTLNFNEIFYIIKNLQLIKPELYLSLTSPITSVFNIEIYLLDAICLLLFLAAMAKSAQLGLHNWLADAMEGPTPVSALIHAATMVTAGVFLTVRCSFLFEQSANILNIIMFIGSLSCLFGATVALAQNDLKKIIAYSTCSQLGYMFIAISASAYNIAIFHLATHAFFKALLFLLAGNIIHATNKQDIIEISNINNISLRKKMPFTYYGFWLASLSMMGIFPLAGFFSKDAIIEAAYFTQKFAFIASLSCCFFTSIYSMRIIFRLFHFPADDNVNDKSEAHEAPLVMNLPLLLLAIGAIASGAFFSYCLDIKSLEGYLKDFVITENHHIPFMLSIAPICVSIIGAIFSFLFYFYRIDRKINLIFCLKIKQVLFNGYYIDKIYKLIFIRSFIYFSSHISSFDIKVIDRFGPEMMAKITIFLSKNFTRIQNGFLHNYLLISLSSIILFSTFYLF